VPAMWRASGHGADLPWITRPASIGTKRRARPQTMAVRSPLPTKGA
jgi:hypothetical protein